MSTGYLQVGLHVSVSIPVGVRIVLNATSHRLIGLQINVFIASGGLKIDAEQCSTAHTARRVALSFLVHNAMPRGQKTPLDVCLIVERMLAAQKDIIEIVAITGLSKRQIQRIEAAIKTTGSPIPYTDAPKSGRPRILAFDNVEVCCIIRFERLTDFLSICMPV
jgi:hypothetical protein